MLDSLVSAWILEFILRQPVDDYLVHSLLLALPLTSPLPLRLRLTLLIRRLASDLSRRTISLRTLHTIELIYELQLPSLPSVPMRAAYAAVALHCAAEPLRSPTFTNTQDAADFFDAVNRIWNCRVGDLEQSMAAGLVSDELRAARKEMEAAVIDQRVRAEVAERNTKAAALETVKSYLKFALEEMGPPLIDHLSRETAYKGIGAGECCARSAEVDGILDELRKKMETFAE